MYTLIIPNTYVGEVGEVGEVYKVDFIIK